MVHVALLVGCALAIYFACEWFVGAVEWLGARLKMGHTAVGTILAAAGTALPESVVTLVAVLFGHPGTGDDIGVGAALGGPLVVGTIAYGVTGVMVLTMGRRAVKDRAAKGEAGARPDTPPAARQPGDEPAATPAGDTGRRLARDQSWFLAIFVVKVGLGLVAFAFKPWLGIAFFGAYALYFHREVTGAGERASDEHLAPLRFQPRRETPTTTAIVAQTLATLIVIFAASQLFVTQLEWAGPQLGLPAAVVALLLAPIATELPEVMNAIIWVRQGKTQLALANLSGSMMIQATVPSGIGLLFTPWLFDSALMLAAGVTIAAIGYLLWLLRAGRLTPARLAAAGLFYGVFAVGLAVI